MENPEGIAVCLSCGNEWTVREPGVKKKRKCPACGKYRIKLKSEMVGEAGQDTEKGDKAEVAGENNPKPGEKGADAAPKISNKSSDSPEKGIPGEVKEGTPAGGSLYLVVALLAIGAVTAMWFLRAPHSERRVTAAPAPAVRFPKMSGARW